MHSKTIAAHRLNHPVGLMVDKISYDNAYNKSTLHRHDYWEVFAFRSGNGIHSIGLNDFSFGSNSLHFVMPQQAHEMDRSSESDGLVLMFTDEYFASTAANRQLLTGLQKYYYIFRNSTQNTN